MIKNERQYRITKAQADKFAKALHEMTTSPQRVGHPVLRKAQIAALQSQLEDLHREIAEYETLRSGKRKVVALGSLEELPKSLIQARIAAGLSQESSRPSLVSSPSRFSAMRPLSTSQPA